MQDVAVPRAQRIPTVITVHGHPRVDEYAWLQDKNNPDVIAYLEAENRYTEEMTRHAAALQAALFKEMKGRVKETDTSAPVKIDEYWYYERTEAGKQYPIYCRKRHSFNNPEEMLLDPNEMAKGRPFFSLGVREVSPDHRKLAYSVDLDGSEHHTLFVRDLETGVLFEESIANIGDSFAWMETSDAFFYTTRDEAWRPHKVFKHILGTSPDSDALLYHEQDERFYVEVSLTRSRNYILLGCFSKVTTEFRYMRADRHDAQLKLFQPREQGHQYHIDHCGNFFFIRTNDNAVNFKVAKTPVTMTRKAHWQEVIPHRDDIAVEHIYAFQDHLVVYERADGLRRIRIVNLRTGGDHIVSFPEPAYSMMPDRNPVFETHVVRFTYSSLITPDTTVDYDMNIRRRTIVKRREIPDGYDASRYKTERVFVEAGDGARIPLSLAYKRGIKRDGSNPVYLYGYGAYGTPRDPMFDANLISLLERDFVLAIAHVRGSGENGRRWYEDGKFLKKKNTFTDFIACGKYLVRRRYTIPSKMLIGGVSAGGLLIGAVLNMRPDLWGAAIARVPFVDLMSVMLDPTLPLTVLEYEEWGNPNDTTYYEYMVSYAPYDQVRAQDYPKILVTAGLNDTRVLYWGPAKWVAKLRQMKTDRNVLLLKTNMSAGHRGVSGRYDLIKERAFEYAFAIDALGVEKRKIFSAKP